MHQPSQQREVTHRPTRTPSLQNTPTGDVKAALQLHLFTLPAPVPWKNIFTHREYFAQVVFSALFLQPPDAVSAVRSPRRGKAKGAGNVATSQVWVTHHIHLDIEVSVLCAWTGGISVTSGAGCSLSLLPEQLLPCSRKR